jgi:hypothetical protein
MKLNLFSKLSLASFALCLSFSSYAQEKIRVMHQGQVINNTAGPLSQSISRYSAAPVNETSAKPPLTTCSDKVNYVGNTIAGSFKLGGYNGFSGVYQVFPAYFGKVIGVEYTAAKYNGSSPTMSIGITNANSAGYPGSSFAGPPVPVLVTSTAVTTYTVMFPTAITVSGASGFGVAFFNFETTADSAKFYCGPVKSGFTPDYSFLTNQTSGSYTSVNTYFGQDIDFIFRPIIQTSVNPTWLSARTNTGCGAPAVYQFTNTSAATPSYVNNSVINPSGVDMTIDYDDGGGVMPYNTTVMTHTYTANGTYNAKQTLTYNGWTNNCIATNTANIVVDNPVPAFSYTANGLTVVLQNNSGANLTSFVWNFGDLTTSTQQNPGSHTFSTPGTYVIELEAMAPCGKVKYSLTVTVSANTVSIDKNTDAASRILLYPNPAANVLKLSNSGPRLSATVEIYDVTGKLLQSSENNELLSGKASIDITSLKQGIYFIKLHNEYGDLTRTFIKE